MLFSYGAVGLDRTFQKHDMAGGKAGFELKEKQGQTSAAADGSPDWDDCIILVGTEKIVPLGL